MNRKLRTECRRGHGPESYRRDISGAPGCRACWRLKHPRQARLTDRARFEARIDKTAGLWGCWVWTGGRVSDGYGRVRYQGATWWAHRLAFYLANGHLPEAVCHRCDNPPCCNPAHLREGTLADNAEEMWAKGRARAVAAVVKVTPETVALLRAFRGSRSNRRVLADRLGVSLRTAYRYAAGYQLYTERAAA